MDEQAIFSHLWRHPVDRAQRDLAVTIGILTVAAWLRFWGIDFGLPMAESRPDELNIAFQAMKFGRGDLNPHSFNYPTFFKYIVFGLYGAYYGIGRALHWFSGQEEFLRSFFSGAVTFRLLMRAWSAAMGTACVAMLLWAPGRKWSAALLAVAMLHVRDSHFGVTDPTLTTLCVASVLASMALRVEGTPSVATFAGLLGGLAASTKYNGALTAVPLVLAAWASPGDTVVLATRGLAGMALAFVAGSPYVLFDFATFKKDFLFEMKHLAEGHRVDVGPAWLAHARGTLPNGVGVPMLLAGVGGLVAALWRDWKGGLVLLSFPLAWYVAMGRGETAFYRYMLPMVPFLAIGAGLLVDSIPRPMDDAPAWRRHLKWPVFLLCALPTAWSSVAVVSRMAAGDTRDAMGAWIEANVPTDATIVHGGTYSGAPMLQRNVANQTREYMAKQGRSDAAGFRKPDDPKWYDPTRPMYDVLILDKEGLEFASKAFVDGTLARPPRWLLLEESGPAFYSAVPPEIRALAATRYEVAHIERAGEGSAEDAVYDEQDAFYLPVAGLSEVTRMGPDLTLYRLRP